MDIWLSIADQMSFIAYANLSADLRETRKNFLDLINIDKDVSEWYGTWLNDLEKLLESAQKNISIEKKAVATKKRKRTLV